MAKNKAQVKSEKSSLKEVIADGAAQRKGKRGVSKTAVTMHKSATAGEATKQDGTPTSEELAQINQYTRTPKTADDVYVLHTLSANTLPDRDDDYFDKDTLSGFAKLEQPYSPTGKSYMVGHDYTKLPIGRIFDTGETKAEGTDFLTNKVYIPRTEENKGLIDSVDFGVNWAVSVGVLLEAQLCSICETNQMNFFGMGICESGHWKGDFYNPDETETDSWGDILPSTPDDPKAVKAMGIMKGAKDFYELSQVFLGAQFFAAVDQNKGVTKAFKGVSTSIPVLGLSRKDARDLNLPLQHVDSRVADAIEKYVLSTDDDGTLRWKDADNLVWTYTPGDEVLCLGKQAEDDITEKEEQHGEEADGTTRGAGEGGVDDVVEDPEHDRAGVVPEDVEHLGVEDRSSDELGEARSLTADDPELDDSDDTEDEADVEDDVETDDDDEEDGEEDSEVADESPVDKSAVLAAIKSAGLGNSYVMLASEASGTGLDEVLGAASSRLKALSKQVKELTPQAALGDEYLKSKRSTVIDWYVKAKGFGTQKGVNTSRIEKVLDTIGADIEMMDSMAKEYEDEARSKMPRPTSRSTADKDPNERQAPMPAVGTEDEVTRPNVTATVTRIHG